MATGTVAAFEASLDRLDVGRTRTNPDGFRRALRELLVEPAVGAPLPSDDVSLPEGVRTEPTPADLEAAQTGVTAALFAVADYGSVALEPTPDGVEPASLFPDRHVVVLRAADVEPDMPAAFERLGPRVRERRTSVVFATGPSATADMGALVRGAHGPKVVHVVILDDRNDGTGDRR